MNRLMDESIIKEPSGIREGEELRGQLFGNQIKSVKKIGSGEEFMLNLDISSLTPIQKSQDMNEHQNRQAIISFDINTFRGEGIDELAPKDSSSQPKFKVIKESKDVFIESANNSIILNEDYSKNTRARESSIQSQQGVNRIESREDGVINNDKNKIKNDIEVNISPREELNNTKLKIVFNNEDNLREYSNYSKRDQIIKPLGSSKKIPSEGTTPLAKAITMKRKPLNEVWKKKGLNILFYIKKYVMLLKNISRLNNFRSLSKAQFEIINDRANNYNYYKYNNYLINAHTSFMEKLLFMGRQRIRILNTRFIQAIYDYLMRNMVIINPESVFKLVWDGFMLFLLVINIFYIPLKIAFEESGGLSIYLFNSLSFQNKIEWPQILVFFLNDIPGWTFMIDIVLNFFTAYYKKGVIITDLKAIFKWYLKNQFFFDLFVFLPFIISQYFQIKYLDAILLLRFNKILKITNNYIDLLNLKSDQAAVFDLIKLIILILFIAHFCGCTFYLVSYIELQNGIEANWLNHLFKIEFPHQQDWFTNYIASFYWAVITMITVGYGDITPTTTEERIFVIVICLLSCGVFAYSVNSIGSIIGAITKKATDFKQKMSLLTIHMKKRGLSTELQMKVKKYFEYLNDEKLEDNQEGENMLKELAGSLKHEIAVDIYGKILNQKKIFKLNFSQAFLMDLAPKLKEKRLGPEEIVYDEYDSQPKIYFVMKGNVNLFIKAKKSPQKPYTVLKTVSKNGVFGELGFFSQMAQSHGAITTNVVSLVYINIEDFLEVIKYYPIDHQKYMYLKDNYILYNRSKGLDGYCWGCGQFKHQIDQCPLLNYIPNKDQICLKFMKSEPMERIEYKRQRYKSTSPWISSDSLKQAVVELIVEIEQIKDIEDLYHRLEEMENSDDEFDHGGGSDQDDNHSEYHRNDTNSHLKEMRNNPVIPKQEEKNDTEILNNIIRRGNRQKTYRKNPHPLQHKASIGPHPEKQRYLTIIKKPSDILEDSLGLFSKELTEDPLPQNPSFKDIRASIKRATFIKKMSTKKTGGNNTGVFDDDTYQLLPESEKKKRSIRKGAGKTLGASNLNNGLNKQLNIAEQEQQKIELEINLREFSKVLDLDMPKEYKEYYPNNNSSNTIRQYNEGQKIIQKEGSSLMGNLIENPKHIKEIYKNIKNKNSSFLVNKYNSNLGNNFMTPKSSSNRILRKQVGHVNFSNSSEPKFYTNNPSKFRAASFLNHDDS